MTDAATDNSPGSRGFVALVWRALQLHCPVCDTSGIFRHPWELKPCCPNCGYAFERESGYFLGAYALNLLVAEVFGLGAVMIFLFRSDLGSTVQTVIAVIAAILLPVIFYPWSRTLWMALDLTFFAPEADQDAPLPTHGNRVGNGSG